MDNTPAPDHGDQPKQSKSMSTRELRALLQLTMSLGITAGVGIFLFFLAGLYADRKLREWGLETHGAGLAIGVILGVLASFYWGYIRIKKHLSIFAPKTLVPSETENPDDAPEQ